MKTFKEFLVEDVKKLSVDDKLNSDNAYTRRKAFSSKKITPEHISKGLEDKDEWVRTCAASHPNATKEHLDKAIKDPEQPVRIAAVEHPKATPEHIAKGMNDEDVYVRAAASKVNMKRSSSKNDPSIEKLKELHSRSEKIHKDHYKLTKDIEDHLDSHPEHRYLFDENYVRKINRFQGDITPSRSHLAISDALGIKPNPIK